MSEENKKVELNNEELEKVAGGSHKANGRTYSDSTYEELGWGQSRSVFHCQKPSHHPLIVTLFNSCSYPYASSCAKCEHRAQKAFTSYCLIRSEECDNYK